MLNYKEAGRPYLNRHKMDVRSSLQACALFFVRFFTFSFIRFYSEVFICLVIYMVSHRVGYVVVRTIDFDCKLQNQMFKKHHIDLL